MTRRLHMSNFSCSIRTRFTNAARGQTAKVRLYTLLLLYTTGVVPMGGSSSIARRRRDPALMLMAARAPRVLLYSRERARAPLAQRGRALSLL